MSLQNCLERGHHNFLMYLKSHSVMRRKEAFNFDFKVQFSTIKNRMFVKFNDEIYYQLKVNVLSMVLRTFAMYLLRHVESDLDVATLKKMKHNRDHKYILCIRAAAIS